VGRALIASCLPQPAVSVVVQSSTLCLACGMHFHGAALVTLSVSVLRDHGPHALAQPDGTSVLPSVWHASSAQLIDALKADRRLGAALQSPSVSYGSTNLFMRGPLEEATRGNLSRPLSELVDGSGSVVQARLLSTHSCSWPRLYVGRASDQ